MNTTLRHDTGARITLKTPTRALVTPVGKGAGVLISVGVSPIATTPVRVAALTKVA